MIDQALTTDNAVTVVTLSEIAEQANLEHHAAQRLARKTARSANGAISHAVECGRLLIQAKELVEHGAWLPWLDQNFEGKPRTAQGYMKAARGELRQMRDQLRISESPVDDALQLVESPAETPRATTWEDIGTELPEVLEIGWHYLWNKYGEEVTTAIWVEPFEPEWPPVDFSTMEPAHREYLQHIRALPYVRFYVFAVDPNGGGNQFWDGRGFQVRMSATEPVTDPRSRAIGIEYRYCGTGRHLGHFLLTKAKLTSADGEWQRAPITEDDQKFWHGIIADAQIETWREQSARTLRERAEASA